MSASAFTPIRQFRVGATNLPDPDPSLAPVQVLEMYAANYPALRFAVLDEPTVEGDVLVYVARMPQVQAKG